LEDLAFHCLDPDTYKKIARLLDERRVDRERNVAAAVERVGDELKKAGVEGEVSGRAKHIHSIWRKMTRKGVDFDRIFDVSAVRVLTPDVTACYAALGVVHALWRPIRGEFDDYIANPKDNGYRALHTAVIGPNGKNLEVQIRTYEMHQEAELGVAAHWSYKEGARQDVELQRRIASLRKALEVPDENGELRDLRSEAFLDRVYVLTPKGKVMELPRGATPLDFAYHVHSEIGHRCKGAKVDGKLVTLDYILKTGDRVEIMTSRQAAPSREWLNPHVGYLKTVRARAKVRQWFRTQDYDRNVASGRTLLDRELQRLGLSSLNLEKLAQRLGKDRVDDMLEALGRGGISPGQLAAVLAEQQPPALRAPDKPLELPATRVAQGVGGIHILGVDNLLTASAGCCQPVPGDPIGGYITRGRGVTIHRRSCPNLGRLERENPERLIRVEWSAKPGDLFQVEIEVVAHERPGLTKAMTAVLAEQHINVMALDSRSDPKRGLVSSVVTLQIGSIDQIGEALAEISQLPGVVEVRRRTVG
jgi:GTP pyrophosphokinase